MFPKHSTDPVLSKRQPEGRFEVFEGFTVPTASAMIFVLEELSGGEVFDSVEPGAASLMAKPKQPVSETVSAAKTRTVESDGLASYL